MEKKNTYESYSRSIEELQKKINKIEDDCAKKGDDFDTMIEKTQKERLQIYFFDKERRLIKDPVISFNKTFFEAKTFTLQQFVDLVNDNVLTDNDGTGFYATEKSVSDVQIMPSDILENIYRTDFSHVIWQPKTNITV